MPKNIAMASGLLQIVAFGAGAFRLDGRHRHASNEAAASRYTVSRARAGNEGRSGSCARVCRI
jgi:hypothetical protein